MSTLDVLDVAIGVIFLYLIMSLICSSAVEFLESLLQYRARDLDHGVRELLQDPGLVKRLYDHPLVSSLYKGTYVAPKVQEPAKDDHKDLGSYPMFEKWRPSKWRLPSYIPSRSFALALVDILSNGSEVKGMTPAAGTPKVTIDPEKIIAGTFVKAQSAVEGVKALVSAAGRDAEKARENIEEWFNSSMDRVSGWYKRRTQTFLLVIAMVMSFYFNVDSIEVAETLASDKGLREATVAAAINYSEADAEARKSQPAPPADGSKPDLSAAGQAFDDQVKRLKGLNLPIGWDTVDVHGNPRSHGKLEDLANASFQAWLTKLLGLLITAGAVSLGAPFWFDMLNKIIVVRSTVKPKEKSGTEASKDPTQLKS